VRLRGTQRHWPPQVDQELAHLLRQWSIREFGTEPDEHPDLKAVMAELDAWLEDPRNNNYYRTTEWKYRTNEWKSMVFDTRRALRTRGPQLASRTPALTDLLRELEKPKIAQEVQTNPAVRDHCRALGARSCIELATPGAAEAAFNDLVDAVSTASTSSVIVDAYLQTLDATLSSADRALVREGRDLAGVLDNSAFVIRSVLHDLDGAPLPDRSNLDEDAELSLDDRLALCRRLMRQPATPGHHVVWTCYSHARARAWWQLTLGPVTFFDGPALLGALESVSSNSPTEAAHAAEQLPAELLSEDELGPSRWSDMMWPEDNERWVAVRVDLREGSYADPVRVAQGQADALVKLAGFHSGRTSWRQLNGYVHIIDDVLRVQSSFAPPIVPPTGIDTTDDTLAELRPQLAHHLPIDDPRLLELLEAAAIIESHDEDADPTSLLHDVRVIELLASRCSNSWQKHLKETFAIRWARACVMDEIYRSVQAAVGDPQLRGTSGLPQPNELLAHISDGSGRVQVHYDVALAALPVLARELPDHYEGARRIRTTARRTRNIHNLNHWITELVQDYGQRVERLSRCRNSFTHGGPINLNVAATVHLFAKAQATHTTSTGLWAVISGCEVKEAHDKRRADDDTWRNGISTAHSVYDALGLP